MKSGPLGQINGGMALLDDTCLLDSATITACMTVRAAEKGAHHTAPCGPHNVMLNAAVLAGWSYMAAISMYIWDQELTQLLSSCSLERNSGLKLTMPAAVGSLIWIPGILNTGRSPFPGVYCRS